MYCRYTKSIWDHEKCRGEFYCVNYQRFHWLYPNQEALEARGYTVIPLYLYFEIFSAVQLGTNTVYKLSMYMTRHACGSW